MLRLGATRTGHPTQPRSVAVKAAEAVALHHFAVAKID
jgi:hypothetical protein